MFPSIEYEFPFQPQRELFKHQFLSNTQSAHFKVQDIESECDKWQ